MSNCLLLLFLFFKQKTAYDMRISDWSSDVCSSDLFQLHLGALAQHVRQIRQCFGKIAAGFPLDSERDDEELKFRRAEPVGCFLKRCVHRSADLDALGKDRKSVVSGKSVPVR